MLRIETNYDFTPKGKRTAKIVKSTQGSQLRWYVGGRIYVAGADPKLTKEWLGNEGAVNHLPQPW